ncbi:unnamed protein product [Adineta ricciae]|uniref:TAF6 C-terminal HEAT repeat domain-containing protein n=1 Tax=Adineta ricciae TaxID=249248 RepID=A0A815NVP1_ADIRI|nr:unnamed protein product [Adineta ricciae]CAF1439087.1 unnamed protein product [Adineta ricciae]
MIWLENLPNDWWIRYQSSITFSTECIREITIELLFIVRNLIIDTRTFARACKRDRLRVNDFENALENRNIRHSSLKNDVQEKKSCVISISSLIQSNDQLSRTIKKLELTMHWLAIDGQQPITSENPLPNFSQDHLNHPHAEKKTLSAELSEQSPMIQQLFHLASSTQINRKNFDEHVHPLTKNNLTIKPICPLNLSARRLTINNQIPTIPSFSSLLGHELSLEQQFYFKMLTESYFNGTDQQQSNTVRCLSSDAALQPLLPRLLLFISKGIETNVHLHDFDFLSRFLSLLTNLLNNRFLSFDKYLHTILPSLLTCLICIFETPKIDTTSSINDSTSHSMIWTIREQASDLIHQLQQKYSFVSCLTDRITSVIKSLFINNDERISFSIVYACFRTLLLIDMEQYHPFIINTIRNGRKMYTFESDCDLDYTSQETIFREKINELLVKYNLNLENV